MYINHGLCVCVCVCVLYAVVMLWVAYRVQQLFLLLLFPVGPVRALGQNAPLFIC